MNLGKVLQIKGNKAWKLLNQSVIKNKIVDLFGYIPKMTIGTIDSISCRYYHRYFKQDYSVNISEYSAFFLKYLQSNDNLLI